MNDMSRRGPSLERQIKPLADEPARPRAVRSGPFGVLDIGSTKIACLIGRAGIRWPAAGLGLWLAERPRR